MVVQEKKKKLMTSHHESKIFPVKFRIFIMIYPDQNYLGMSAFQVASREATKSSSTPACIRTEQASGSRGGNVSMRVSANEPSLLSGSPCRNCSFTAAHAQSQIMGAERGGGEHPVSDITERAVQRTGHSTTRPPPLHAVSPSHRHGEKGKDASTCTSHRRKEHFCIFV